MKTRVPSAANDMADDFSGRLTPPAPRRAFDGIDDALIFAQPDAQLYSLLRQSAFSGSYIPFGGRARDVIDTLFPTHLAFPPLPPHARAPCTLPVTLTAVERGSAASRSAGQIGRQNGMHDAPLDLSVPVPRPRLARRTAAARANLPG